MAVSLHGDRVEIFKFAETGATELIFETADFLEKARQRGIEYEFLGYKRGRHDEHIFSFRELDK
jgi:hypothetical protein